MYSRCMYNSTVKVETRNGVPGNREHQHQNSREQGTFMKNLGTREHWLKNGREQGTLALKAPGTGNIGLKTAGSREHSIELNGVYCLTKAEAQNMKSSVELPIHP